MTANKAFRSKATARKVLGRHRPACADIELLGVERGHRALVVTRKGGKVVTIPLRGGPRG